MYRFNFLIFILMLLILFPLFSFFLVLIAFFSLFYRVFYFFNFKTNFSENFNFYKLSIILMSKLLSINGSMSAEQVYYINSLINSLSLSVKEKSYLFRLFNFKMRMYTNTNNILSQIREHYINEKSLINWLYNSLNTLSSLSQFKSRDVEIFLEYIANFLNLEKDSPLSNFDFSNRSSYYEILGCSENSTNREIKSAYKKLVLKNHPDKFKDEDERQKAQAIFIKIQDAYEKIAKERGI